MVEKTSKDLSQFYLNLEKEFGAHDYHPLPVVLEKGEGVFMWDVNGKKYYDFLSAYSAVNQGHCHPELVSLIKNQAETLTLTSRAFHNNKLGEYMEFATKLFGFDKLLPMNTGAEGVETSIKLSRKWGYLKKKVDENQAKIVVCNNNFHGRTTTVISFSTDPGSKDFFGPHTPGFIHIPHGEISALENEFKKDKNIVAFLVEPIQGEGGDNHFRCEFMQNLRDIADENDIILIYDEVQTGVGVTGKMWAHQHFSTGKCTNNCKCSDSLTAKPDIIAFGKKTQVCGVAASTRFDDVEGNVFRESSRINSTWGGSLVDMVRLTIYLELIEKENLVEKAAETGLFLKQRLHDLQNEFPNLVSNARGKGLYCAFDLPSSEDRDKLANLLLDEGSILLGSGNYSIRFRPHLNVTEDDINFGMDCFRKALNKLS